VNGRPTIEQVPGEVTPGTLPTPVTDLLAAVVEALDIPLPSIDDADERAYTVLLERRATLVRIQLAALLDFPNVDISRDAAELRSYASLAPVTYAVYESTTDGGQS